MKAFLLFLHIIAAATAVGVANGSYEAHTDPLTVTRGLVGLAVGLVVTCVAHACWRLEQSDAKSRRN